LTVPRSIDEAGSVRNVAGIGEVEEHLTEGGNEHFELVGVSR
jgi:hypothetical protein